MEFNYKQLKCKAFQFLSIVKMLHPNTKLSYCHVLSNKKKLCKLDTLAQVPINLKLRKQIGKYNPNSKRKINTENIY